MRKVEHNHRFLIMVINMFRRLLCWVKGAIEDLLFPIRMRLGRKIMYDEQRQIVQVSSTELIKGPCTLQEYEAMRYFATNTYTILPRIHRIYRRRTGLYIAMDYIHGERLDQLWPGLDGREQRKLAESVAEQIDAMRSIAMPADLSVSVASVGGGEVHDGMLQPGLGVGPFISLADFRDFLQGNPNLLPYKHTWDTDRDGHSARSVLTHGDIALRNIIRRYPDHSLVIIDWETAGWWPVYWEKIKISFGDFPEHPGWIQAMDGLLADD